MSKTGKRTKDPSIGSPRNRSSRARRYIRVIDQSDRITRTQSRPPRVSQHPARSIIHNMVCACQRAPFGVATRRAVSSDAILPRRHAGALQFDQQERETHGLVSTSEWTGVPLSTLLKQAGLKPDAAWVLAEGADAAVMTRSVPIDKCLSDERQVSVGGETCWLHLECDRFYLEAEILP